MPLYTTFRSNFGYRGQYVLLNGFRNDENFLMLANRGRQRQPGFVNGSHDRRFSKGNRVDYVLAMRVEYVRLQPAHNPVELDQIPRVPAGHRSIYAGDSHSAVERTQNGLIITIAYDDYVNLGVRDLCIGNVGEHGLRPPHLETPPKMDYSHALPCRTLCQIAALDGIKDSQ